MIYPIIFRITLTLLYVSCLYAPRSIYRMSNKSLPCITTRWLDEKKEYTLCHPNLEVGPLFTNYQPEYLAQHTLPHDYIVPRNSSLPPVHGDVLRQLLEGFISELRTSHTLKKSYTHFIILKKRDYNPKSHAGLLIVKFRRYPFVAKIFVESAPSFVQPFTKGFEPSVFFMMGSVTRYLSGFTRIKNAEIIRARIIQSEYWHTQVDIPRKWYWEPPHQRRFELKSTNLGTKNYRVILPSIYIIIADAITPDQHFHMLNREHRVRALEFAHYIGIRIDPHIDNFMIEKETGMLVLVDAEHFPTMVGLRKPIVFDNYFDWYTLISCKGFIDCFGRTKDVRKKLQYADDKTVIDC